MIFEENTFKVFFFTVSETVTRKECFDLDAAMQENTTNLYNHLKHPHKAFEQSYERLTQALKCWLTCFQEGIFNQLPAEKGNFTCVYV